MWRKIQPVWTRGSGLLAGAEGGTRVRQEGDGKDEDAEGDGAVAGVDDEEGDGEEEGEEGLGLVGVDGEGVVGGVEHLGQGDEVEEDGGDGGGDGDVAPARAVVEGRGQDRERGDAVEEDRDSEPEEGHEFILAARADWPQTLSISCGCGDAMCLYRHGVVVLPLPPQSMQSLRNRHFKSGLRFGLWVKAKARLVAGLSVFSTFSISGVSRV